jgi:tetratricopeptide (TPR) repeat protein
LNTERADDERGLPVENHDSVLTASPEIPGGAKGVWFCVGLFVLSAVTFLPAVHNDFLNYDDPTYVTENRQVMAGLSWAAIRWAFTDLSAGFWHPLTWLSHMLDCELFGLRSWGHHLTNVLLHVANTVLLFLFLNRMMSARWRSALVAALFAVHPLHVESVAWVAERKDVLSTFFGFLALLFYARYVKSKNRKPKSAISSYLLALSFFVCGLMSKSMVVTLPILMLAFDYWPLNRFAANGSRTGIVRLFLEKLPFFALAFVAGLLTMHAERIAGAVALESQRPIRLLGANAILSCCHYLWQTIWPANLAAFYPFPESFSGVSVAIATAVLVGISIGAALLVQRHPYFAMGWFWFLVTLLPVSGLVQVGSHSRADRYTYVPLVGVFIFVTWGAHELARRWHRWSILLLATAAVSIVLCATVSRRQIAYWRNSEILFRHAINVTGGNFIAHLNLGDALQKEGLYDEAIQEFERALEIKPNNPRALYGLGIAYDNGGRVDEAVRQYLRAAELKPDYAEVFNSLGLALRKKGLADEAMSSFLEALKLKPDFADAHHNLGIMLAQRGQLDDAIGQYQQARDLKPEAPALLNDLGIALGRKGLADEALLHLQRAVELDPNSADIRYNLGNALARKGRLQEAIDQFQESLRLNANAPDVQNNLGVVLSHVGRLEEAISHFQEAVKLRPEYAEAQTNLAAALKLKEAPRQ